MRTTLGLALFTASVLACPAASKEDFPPRTLGTKGNQLYYNGDRVFLVSYGHYGEMCDDRLTPYDGRYSMPGAWKKGLWRNDPGWHWKAYLDLISDAGLNFARVWLYTSRNTRGASYRSGACGDHLVGLLPWNYRDKKWEIHTWDENYWKRLQSFCEYAHRRGIIVQLCLFARQYTPASSSSVRWAWCPLNPNNNLDFPYIASQESYYATGGKVWDNYTKRIIQKTVASVGDCGNIIYEIMNEENARRDEWGSAVAREISAQYIQQKKRGSLLISNNVVYAGVMIDGSHNAKPVTGKIPGIASDDYAEMIDKDRGKLGQRLERAFAAWDQGNVGYEHKTYDYLTGGSAHSCKSHYELRLIDDKKVNLLARYARGAGVSHLE